MDNFRRTLQAGSRCTNASQQPASKTPNSVGVHVQGHQDRVQARDAAHLRRLDKGAGLHLRQSFVPNGRSFILLKPSTWSSAFSLPLSAASLPLFSFSLPLFSSSFSLSSRAIFAESVSPSSSTGITATKLPSDGLLDAPGSLLSKNDATAASAVQIMSLLPKGVDISKVSVDEKAVQLRLPLALLRHARHRLLVHSGDTSERH